MLLSHLTTLMSPRGMISHPYDVWNTQPTCQRKVGPRRDAVISFPEVDFLKTWAHVSHQVLAKN